MSSNDFRFSGLSSQDAKIKFATAKALVELAKSHPERLYPAFDSIVPILDDENSILKWCAIDAIGYLAEVDANHLIDSLLPKLFAQLRGGKMITANHAIEALGRIARARPELEPMITPVLLKVASYRYDTPECTNIAIGKSLEALGSYTDLLKRRNRIRSFAELQTHNRRPATKRKAETLLKKLRSN